MKIKASVTKVTEKPENYIQITNLNDKSDAPEVSDKKTEIAEKNAVCEKKAYAGHLLRVGALFSAAKEKLKAYAEKKDRDELIKHGITASLALIVLIVCGFTCSFGYAVKSNDKIIGYVHSKSALNKAFVSTAEEIYNATGESFSARDNISVSPAIAAKNKFLKDDAIGEMLKSTVNTMVPAYSVSAGGNMIVALPNEDMALAVIQKYKESFCKDIEYDNAELSEDFTVKYEFVPKSLLHTTDSALNFLLSGKFIFYTPEKDETSAEIAEKTGIPAEKIDLCGADGTFLAGQVIKIYTGEMFADVLATSHTEREENIPYETVQQESSDVYKGQVRVLEPGDEGTKYIEENITYINGIESKRDVLNENVLKAPKTQVELVGTKEPPPSVGTGELSMPTTGDASLSSRFGSRWGRNHTGIDLSAPVGTPIYAADNGTVVYAEFNNGGYGYLIRIDHDNGIVTYYAHCSELLVSEGDVVAKGDLIAKVGSTGRSTGAHLHFEVRENGVPVDPLPYLNQ